MSTKPYWAPEDVVKCWAHFTSRGTFFWFTRDGVNVSEMRGGREIKKAVSAKAMDTSYPTIWKKEPSTANCQRPDWAPSDCEKAWIFKTPRGGEVRVILVNSYLYKYDYYKAGFIPSITLSVTLLEKDSKWELIWSKDESVEQIEETPVKERCKIRRMNPLMWPISLHDKRLFLEQSEYAKKAREELKRKYAGEAMRTIHEWPFCSLKQQNATLEVGPRTMGGEIKALAGFWKCGCEND